MRFTIAYYLFLFYSLAIFRPVIPILSDGFSHVFARAIHIATVHARYGSNHVDKELEKTASDNSKNHNGITKAAETFVVHISTGECRYILYEGKLSKNYPGMRLHLIADIFIPHQSPPPKFSC